MSKMTDALKKVNDTVFIGGGRYVYTQFLTESLLDEIWISTEPVILGSGMSAFNTKNSIMKKVHVIETFDLGDNVMVTKYSCR